MLIRDALVCAVTSAVATTILWLAATYGAFRAGEEERLGRLPWFAWAAALALSVGFTLLHAPYLPGPIMLGILAAAIVVSVVTDLRVTQIYNVVILLVAIAAGTDAFFTGHALDFALGASTTAVVAYIAFRQRLAAEGDVKAAVVLGAALGGMFGPLLVLTALLAAGAYHAWRQLKSPVPLVTVTPLAPMLALGLLVALGMAATPAAHYLAVSVH